MRAVLINVNLLQILQGGATLVITYLYNRTLYSSVKYTTLYENKYKIKLNIDDIRIFGCLVIFKTKLEKSLGKLD